MIYIFDTLRGQSCALRCSEWNVSVMKFYYVYILKSLKKDFLYVGYTKNLKRRVAQHNNKKELSTKYYASFDLIHYEAYRNGKDAKRREKYLKTTAGKKALKLILRSSLSEYSRYQAGVTLSAKDGPEFNEGHLIFTF